MQSKQSTQKLHSKRTAVALKVLREIFRNSNSIGKIISKSYRSANKLALGNNDTSLTYGEISSPSFMQILLLTVGKKDGLATTSSTEKVFVDLGSGVGRACFTAALSPFEFTKVWGIEIVDNMTVHANMLKIELLTMIQKSLSTEKLSIEEAPRKEKKVTLIDAVKELLLQKIMLSTDELGNQLSKLLGRKEYRNQLKQYKSLEKFLFSNSDKNLSSQDDSCLTFINFDHTNSRVSLISIPKEDVSKIHDDSENIEKSKHDETFDLYDFESAEHIKDETVSSKESSFLLSVEDAQLLLPCPEIVFETGDIFEVDWWTEADVAYAASLLFSDAMMARLSEKVLLMKPGSWFITLKPLVRSIYYH